MGGGELRRLVLQKVEEAKRSRQKKKIMKAKLETCLPTPKLKLSFNVATVSGTAL